MLWKPCPQPIRGLAAVVFSFVGVAAAQAGPIEVAVNGQPVEFKGVGPRTVRGRVLIPLRGILESLGARVKYNASKKRISATDGQTNVILTLGQRLATVNNEEFILDVPATLIDGTAMVPLRFIGETFGAKVEWNEATRHIEVSNQASGSP
ncbi:MAG TPA: copper amine oxidase N-terminal domain-containing protein [Fimbriimonas sp.]